MKFLRPCLFLCACALVRDASVQLVAAGFPPFTAGRSVIKFTNTVEQAQPDEVKWRLHSEENPGAFDIAKEKFQLIVPKGYSPAAPWGVFLWISAADAPNIPADWEPVLAARKLLFVGALKSGNSRAIFDRVRLAVVANAALRERFNVDGRRVYVSGFSGGARVASMLGVAWADMFSGAMPFMGVNFYTDIPMAKGKTYPPDFIPDDEVLAIAKAKCRYVLVTGEKDFNRADTKSVYENGYRKEKFANVLYLEVPGQGHALPSAKWLDMGLEFLDRGKLPPKEQASASPP